MTRCIVKGCTVHSPLEGEYLCPHCFTMIVTGFVPAEGSTFIHDLHNALLITTAVVDKIVLTMAMGIDGHGGSGHA